MSTTTRLLHATPEQVWEVLCDGWLYPLWVVGASRMRDVDETWPEVGSRLHHSVGTWPLLIDDNTEVLRAQPPSLLELKARGWPAGTARVRLHLEAVGTETQVTIEEDVEDGPGRLVPKPIRDAQLGWRNVESLRRLAYVVEGRVTT
ncbi:MULTISPECIES: SRPBCC domain-containing protein [unclassified Nocardioides]|uniref:SRPBCC family protein n=1 Tax=unclassified Nocardioides TaxID=2615069 RepID=UPI002665849F|nr:SRPBCC family protein [Nocardioides sp. Arc9.136]WKN49702.1 SRPBCC family protein [Nocardioides sp. Arc9.136]